MRPFGEEGPPTGLRRLDAEAEEAEERFVENDGGNGQGEIDDDDGKDIGKEMPGDDF